MRRLRVMPDYRCWPLWDDEVPNNVDPASLGITTQLQERLLAWADEFERDFNWDDPGAPVEPDPAWAAAFEAEGRRLAAELQEELGGNAVVRFWLDEEPT